MAKTILPDSGSYTIIGSQAFRAIVMIAVAGSYVLTGTSATTIRGKGVAAVSGSYAITGQTISVKRIAAEPAAYQLQGQSVTLTKVGLNTLVAQGGIYRIIGQPYPYDPILYPAVGGDGVRDARLYSGKTVNTILEHAVGSDRGSYSVAGTAVTLTRSGTGNTLTPASGSYVITGGSTVLQDRLPMDAGDYQFTGTTTTLRKGKGLVGLTGTYVITPGPVVKLIHNQKISAAIGSYIIAGSSPDANLIRSGSSTKIIGASSGLYNLTGTIANLKAGRVASITSGTYTQTGTTANIPVGRRLLATPGAYTLSGTPTSLRHTRLLPANSDTYTLSGKTASIIRGTHSLVGDSGTYNLFGFSAVLKAAPFVAAGSGTYTLSAPDSPIFPTFRVTHIIADPGNYALTGATTTLLATTHTSDWKKQPPRIGFWKKQPPST